MQLEFISSLIRRRTSVFERSTTQKKQANEYFPDPESEPAPTKFVLYPESSIKVAWDMVTSVVILYQSFTYPYFFAFSTMHDGYYLLDIMATIIFIADIMISFNTAFYRRGAIITDRSEIAKRYLRFWLWIDLISTFPYSWVIEGKTAFTGNSELVAATSSNILYSSPTLLRMLKLTRIMSLLKIAKFRKQLRDLEYFLSSNQLSTVIMALRLLVMMVIVSHWIACLWIYISVENISNYENWIVSGGYMNSSFMEIYVTAMYWAIASMASVGYGDVKALSIVERSVAIICIVIGSGIFTFIISNIGMLVSKQTSDAKLHRERVVKFNSFMKHNEIPPELKFKVRRYMDYIWEKRQVRMLQENDFLDLLSDPLKDAIFFHTRGKILNECPLFKQYMTGQVLLHLSRLLEPRVYAPNDIIFEEGERNTDIHFILLGLIEILHKSTKTVFHNLNAGEYFGQISFFTQQPRKASAHCLEFVETLTLVRSKVDVSAERFPEFKMHLDLVKLKCEDGDLTEIEISCYMCGKLGHAAVDCKRFVLNANADENKSKWLKERRRKTVLVNPFSLVQEPNFKRKPKKPGRRAKVPNYYPDISKMRRFCVLMNEAPDFSTKSVPIPTEAYPMDEYNNKLDIILSEDEPSSDDEYDITVSVRRSISEK
mmetsp:Transcript_3691/g.7896  ORF Transcript_3691/g.7896 Transcript_3691/m.7896 type:complete len:656 (-) Transcript_3691:26-1993(-)